MTDKELTSQLRRWHNYGKLRRCECGSAVIMRYEPGVTRISCIGERKTVAAWPDWCPDDLAAFWNSGRKGSA